MLKCKVSRGVFIATRNMDLTIFVKSSNVRFNHGSILKSVVHDVKVLGTTQPEL